MAAFSVASLSRSRGHNTKAQFLQKQVCKTLKSAIGYPWLLHRTPTEFHYICGGWGKDSEASAPQVILMCVQG